MWVSWGAWIAVALAIALAGWALLAPVMYGRYRGRAGFALDATVLALALACAAYTFLWGGRALAISYLHATGEVRPAIVQRLWKTQAKYPTPMVTVELADDHGQLRDAEVSGAVWDSLAVGARVDVICERAPGGDAALLADHAPTRARIALAALAASLLAALATATVRTWSVVRGGKRRRRKREPRGAPPPRRDEPSTPVPTTAPAPPPETSTMPHDAPPPNPMPPSWVLAATNVLSAYFTKHRHDAEPDWIVQLQGRSSTGMRAREDGDVVWVQFGPSTEPVYGVIVLRAGADRVLRFERFEQMPRETFEAFGRPC